MNFRGLPIGWSFCGYLAVVIASAALLHYLRRTPRFFSLISLPGTVGHELLHFLVGTLTLAKPVKVSLIPKFHRDGSATLGFVMFSNIRWYNALWVGFAPLLALPAAVWLVYYRSAQIPPLSWRELAWSYVAASLTVFVPALESGCRDRVIQACRIDILSGKCRDSVLDLAEDVRLIRKLLQYFFDGNCVANSKPLQSSRPSRSDPVSLV